MGVYGNRGAPMGIGMAIRITCDASGVTWLQGRALPSVTMRQIPKI
jgi:hypothetical protein